MNDENENVTGETGELAPQETEAEDFPVDHWAVDSTDSEEEVQTLTIQVIEDYGSGIIHANLFGSFLICGTLIGLAIWRKFNGS